ncbi:MAG: hypothetical protein IPM61_05075 [Chlorobi bacterium]|nr:hypothetical protein [Chlorobiota bacterium]
MAKCVGEHSSTAVAERQQTNISFRITAAQKKSEGVETFFGKLGLLAMRFAPNSKYQGREKLTSERGGKSHQIHDKKIFVDQKKILDIAKRISVFLHAKL